MTNHKKHLISLKVPANSFKTTAPTFVTSEAAPARPVSKIKSFLSVGIKWPRNKEKSEPGASTDDHGHRPKGNFFSERMHRLEGDISEKSEPFPEAARKQPPSNFQTFLTGLKESFFRFMETVFLLDSPQELALMLNFTYSAPVSIRKAAQASKSRLFSFMQNEDKPLRSETIGVRLSERITSIADRYRSIENKPIPVENRQPAFKMANYRFRVASLV